MSLALISDATGEIVSCRVTHLANKTDKLFKDKDAIKSDKIKTILKFLMHLGSLCNKYDHYCVEEVVHFLALAVHKDYRRRGIAGKVMNAAVDLVRNLEVGPVVIAGEGTSNYTKRIYEKLGFDALAEIIYEEYKPNGEVVFKNMGEQTSTKLYGKVVC